MKLEAVAVELSQRYGHAIGDAYLDIAAILQAKRISPTDITAEEFSEILIDYRERADVIGKVLSF